MRNFFWLIGREFGLFWNNSVMRVLFIGAPILYGLLFGAVYRKGKLTDLPIVVVDEDRSPMSASLIDMLEDNETLTVALVKADKTALHDAMIGLKASTVVMIPEHFEADVLQQRYPEVVVDINTGNIVIANYASKAIQVVLGTFSAGVEIAGLQKRGLAPEVAMTHYEPFKVNYIRYFNKAANYMYFLWPGMLATILQQVLLLVFALSFAQEMETGTFQSVLVPRSGSPFVALLVKLLPYWLMAAVIWLFYGWLHRFFQVPLSFDIGKVTLLGFLMVVAVSFLGILVSVLIPSQLKATELLMVVATPSFVLSGFTWPLSQMPEWLQWVAAVIPLTHFLEAYRVMAVENGSWSAVKPQVNALLIQLLIYGGLAFLVLWWKFSRARKAKHQKA
ncbi:ABC transporter permease [Flavihumibacter rivuli]|uniref:ABC transporter permease n=1 Tax=Flavihumibacter rivuli TaxID=2838156 RepID=UPI001BDEA9DD|nr:ABC transporter permease [Flavihumibacter rivuli]ULQ55308.1 ABC transporter permease [Flavihumibacter rivuli]